MESCIRNECCIITRAGYMEITWKLNRCAPLIFSRRIPILPQNAQIRISKKLTRVAKPRHENCEANTSALQTVN